MPSNAQCAANPRPMPLAAPVSRHLAFEVFHSFLLMRSEMSPHDVGECGRSAQAFSASTKPPVFARGQPRT